MADLTTRTKCALRPRRALTQSGDQSRTPLPRRCTRTTGAQHEARQPRTRTRSTQRARRRRCSPDLAAGVARHRQGQDLRNRQGDQQCHRDRRENATKTRVFVRHAISLAGIHAGTRVEAEGFMRNGRLRLSGIHLDDRAAAAAGTATVDDKGGREPRPPTTRPATTAAVTVRTTLRGTTSPSPEHSQREESPSRCLGGLSHVYDWPFAFRMAPVRGRA